ncbi:hypothetical protein A2856_01640 [Candidatus Uhrbacteria bacterium RIFCSPHIGHO2_01_FULL_63_20]|uniref:Uncharacterized protein n=1 Tax=Candidatus Uhrbacteria bacterium RIFCSPHIGHO2_01_FULL_63_20 TaxID=1802385 RepID=A0A1F7TK72_9BACT|nr:MAG: hypothetical protein A2856_01640 [Candidatus Uhrbacteria bacterium RIFCSPHIGHO2_01_FULL_63_20]
MADDKPSPEPSTALTRQQRDDLDAQFKKERTALRHLEWSITGLLGGASIVIAVVGQAFLGIGGVPTLVGMPLAMLTMLVVRFLAKKIAAKLPVPVSDRTPMVWPILPDPKIMAYASRMEAEVLALADAASDRGVVSKLDRVREALASELSSYRTAAADLTRIEAKKRRRNGRDVTSVDEVIKELAERRDAAEGHVNQCLDAYDTFVSRYLLRRGNAGKEVSSLIDDLLKEIGKKDEAMKEAEKEVETLVPAEAAPSQT